MGRGGALWSEWSEFRWTSLFESNIGSTFILSWTITRRCLRVIHTAYKWVHKGIMLIHMSYIAKNTHCRRRNISSLEWIQLLELDGNPHRSGYIFGAVGAEHTTLVCGEDCYGMLLLFTQWLLVSESSLGHGHLHRQHGCISPTDITSNLLLSV